MACLYSLLKTRARMALSYNIPLPALYSKSIQFFMMEPVHSGRTYDSIETAPLEDTHDNPIYGRHTGKPLD